MKSVTTLVVAGLSFAPHFAYAQTTSTSPELDVVTVQRVVTKFRTRAPEYNKMDDAKGRAQVTGICNLHHVKMTRQIVPVVGLIVFPGVGENSSVGLRNYPNAFLFALPHAFGSPIPEPERTASKFVCPECRRMEMQWIADHPNHPYAKWIRGLPKV